MVTTRKDSSLPKGRASFEDPPKGTRGGRRHVSAPSSPTIPPPIVERQTSQEPIQVAQALPQSAGAGSSGQDLHVGTGGIAWEVRNNPAYEERQENIGKVTTPSYVDLEREVQDLINSQDPVQPRQDLEQEVHNLIRSQPSLQPTADQKGKETGP